MRLGRAGFAELRRYASSGRVVAFDTETTGCTNCDEICQIAAVEYVDGLPARRFSAYICPTCEMNPFAEAVHGLSLDFLRVHGISPEEAMRQFFDFLGGDALLVAHNIAFDMRMLTNECAKFGLSFAPEGLKTCDTLALSRSLFPEMAHHTLSCMVEALGVSGVNSHDALDDAIACAGLFFALLKTALPCAAAGTICF